VIRGGVVGDVDNCDPRTDGRRPRYPIAIGRQIPSTFPGSGRIGRVIGSGAGLPTGRMPR